MTQTQTDDGLTYTIKEFCRHTRMSEKTFHVLRNRGEGPRIIRVGRRVYVSQDTARKWLLTREALSQPSTLSVLELLKECQDMIPAEVQAKQPA